MGTAPIPEPLATRYDRHLSCRKRTGGAVGAVRVSVVIVNYCQWAETVALVRQLRRSCLVGTRTAEVVVVDNHSPGHRAIRRLRRLPWMVIRRWKRNYGFARAVNEGVRLSRGEWILILNPDLSLDADFLAQAVAEAERLRAQDGRIGVIGFRLRHSDGTEQLSSGFFPSFWKTFARIVLPRARRKYCGLTESGPVPWVTGCCMLVRKECLQAVGGFDEEYFLYYEDVDLCRRAWSAGWSVWHHSFPEAVHYRPLHQRSVSVPLRVYTRHSLLAYAKKHWPKWEFVVLTAIVRTEAFIREAWAEWRDDERSVVQLRALGRICLNMAEGRTHRARKRVERVARDQESHAGA